MRSWRWTMYAVYFNPKDFPGKYVVRGFVIGREPLPEREPLAVADTLEQARAALPPGLCMLSRHLDDEPQILETWL